MAKHILSVSGSFILQHLQLEDMRPKEDFRPGCMVDCIDRPALHDGKLLQVDCDNRLGQVEWGTGHVGWWYLKDLTIVEKSAYHINGLHHDKIIIDEYENMRFPINLEIASAESASQ